MLRSADRAPDSFEGLADHEVAGRGRRIRKACGLVRLGDRGETAGDGARRQSGGAVGNVEGNCLGRRGKRRQLTSTAPGLEVAPIVSVSLQCGGGFGRGDEGLRLLDQFFKAGCFRNLLKFAATRRIYWGFALLQS